MVPDILFATLYQHNYSTHFFMFPSFCLQEIIIFFYNNLFQNFFSLMFTFTLCTQMCAPQKGNELVYIFSEIGCLAFRTIEQYNLN